MTTTKTPDQNWITQKAKLRLMFPNLHDDDFKYDYGMKDVMLSNLQILLGKTRPELNTLLKDLLQ